MNTDQASRDIPCSWILTFVRMTGREREFRPRFLDATSEHKVNARPKFMPGNAPAPAAAERALLSGIFYFFSILRRSRARAPAVPLLRPTKDAPNFLFIAHLEKSPKKPLSLAGRGWREGCAAMPRAAQRAAPPHEGRGGRTRLNPRAASLDKGDERARQRRSSPPARRGRGEAPHRRQYRQPDRPSSRGRAGSLGLGGRQAEARHRRARPGAPRRARRAREA